MIIRRLRQDRGWSQEDLARISGVSVRTIQRIENGGRASLETLKCLAAVFETSIPELRKDAEMSDETRREKPVEMEEPAQGAAGLSEEDRAALRYVRYLRRYDDWYDEDESSDRDGWDGWDGGERPPEGLSADERRVWRQVRRERRFYQNLVSYAVIIGFLAVVNLMTSPGYLWFLWAAGGWGIGIAFHAMDVFGKRRLFGDDWERREVDRRLARLAGRPGPDAGR